MEVNARSRLDLQPLFRIDLLDTLVNVYHGFQFFFLSGISFSHASDGGYHLVSQSRVTNFKRCCFGKTEFKLYHVLPRVSFEGESSTLFIFEISTALLDIIECVIQFGCFCSDGFKECFDAGIISDCEFIVSLGGHELEPIQQESNVCCTLDFLQKVHVELAFVGSKGVEGQLLLEDSLLAVANWFVVFVWVLVNLLFRFLDTHGKGNYHQA